MLKQPDTVQAKIKFRDRDLSFEMVCVPPFLAEIRKEGYFIHEPDVISALLNFVRPGDICIDAGANIGYHSILMARLVTGGGRVLAFEPDPNSFEILKQNIALNRVENICLPVPVALWEGNIEHAEFYLVNKVTSYCSNGDYECGYSTFVKYMNAEQTPITVETAALDSVISPDIPIRVLKIDCEGAEEGILHGAEKLLRRGVGAVICEFNFNIIDNDKRIREYMASLGYDFFYLFDNSWLPQQIVSEAKIVQGDEKKFVFNGLFSTEKFVKENWRYGINEEIEKRNWRNNL